jgi:hypothetical protein
MCQKAIIYSPYLIFSGVPEQNRNQGTLYHLEECFSSGGKRTLPGTREKLWGGGVR